ncbi:MAG: Hsp70 family protein [Verrucomicrobia bacterium]|nr:Hsp70 family protein [Verrucomicrobiota bacterium]
MTRTTIDFGIDLGTTNSAIAVLNGVRPEIIKNPDDFDITSSAVGIDKMGTVRVGLRARSSREAKPKDAYIEFKRNMGDDFVYSFQSSGMRRKPEELSAEVLKALRDQAQEKTGEAIDAIVITVPAAFQLPQCNATMKAAQLAGFKQSPLLQEPVAAALAYGFQKDEEGAYWLVYDFGGGTFDAAVIKAEDGTIHVANHGGDNFLGGSDIDWAIVDQIIVPQLLAQYELKDFNRGNERWEKEFIKIKHAVEDAKIELSRSDRTHLALGGFTDSKGEDIELECELTQAEVVRISEPIIQRSVDICMRVLNEIHLSKEAISKVILVGGPTKARYFREMLSRKLSMPLDFSMDPMTVVALGAAVFAGTQRLQLNREQPVAAGEFAIDLKYKPVGIDDTPTIGGKVSSPEIQDFTDFTLELVNQAIQWRSGKISLRPDGVFVANLYAERGVRNLYSIEMFDPEGRRQKTSPDSLTYTIFIGGVLDEQPLPNSIGIALSTNNYDRLFQKGRGLPCKETKDYRTAHLIRQGQSGDFVRIPVVEGENGKADRNQFIGYLEIKGNNIRRDLPAGSDVEVTLSMDANRIITLKAYVPLLDEEFTEKFDSKYETVKALVLKQDLDTEMKRFRELAAKARNTNAQGVDEKVREIEESPLLQEIERAIAANETRKCETRLLEFKIKLDEVADSLEWPSLVCEAQEAMASLEKVVRTYGSADQRERHTSLVTEINQIIKERQSERMRSKLESVWRLYYEITNAQPEYWVYRFQYMEKERAKLTDQNRAAHLFSQGQNFMANNNAVGLQNVVRQLWDLLPAEEREAQRGFVSGVQ